jgi:uncharacterized membrane protein YvbJ
LVNYCPNCGKQVSQGENFCSNCGEKLIEKENEKPSITDEIVESPTPNTINLETHAPNANLKFFKSKKVLITVGIVLIAFIIVLSINLGKQSPSDVAKEFIKDTQENDYDSARQLWSKAGIDYILNKLGDERWINQSMKNLAHRTYGDLDDFEITNEEEVASDKAVVHVKLIFDSGKREDAHIAMVKENGDWKVYAFGTN